MCYVNLNLMVRCVSRRVSFATTHTAMPPFIVAPIVRVHPAALTVRVHEVPRPVRVCSQGGWVRNGIKVDWNYGKYMTICLTSVRCYKRGFNARVGKLKLFQLRVYLIKQIILIWYCVPSTIYTGCIGQRRPPAYWRVLACGWLRPNMPLVYHGYGITRGLFPAYYGLFL
jgi:hypothetical protein